jgi:hypothetical protein
MNLGGTISAWTEISQIVVRGYIVSENEAEQAKLIPTAPWSANVSAQSRRR